MKKLILILLISISCKLVYSQFSIGITLNGIGYHPNSNTDNFKWKISKNGKLVGFASISIIASYRFNNYVGIKIAQNIAFYNCAGKFSGITHIGIDLHDDIIGINNTKNQLSASIGPFWYYRKNWNQITSYKYDPNFIKRSKNKTWEHLFVWYGGQIEYSYSYSKQNAITMTLLPGYPYIYAMGLGAKHTE